MDLLTQLANHYGSDKGSKFHGYTEQYDSLFGPLRHNRFRLLELGVLGGASLRMWADYFPNSEIVGVDLNSYPPLGPRITTIQADLGNEEAVHALVDMGPWDIVLDDASHQVPHQNLSARLLGPAAKKVFIMEDFDIRFRADFGGNVVGVPAKEAADMAAVVGCNSYELIVTPRKTMSLVCWKALSD